MKSSPRHRQQRLRFRGSNGEVITRIAHISQRLWCKSRAVCAINQGMRDITPLHQRLERRRQITDNGCWVWTGAKDHYGYGKMQFGGRYGQKLGVHRVAAHAYLNFDLNSELKVLHHCDNPSCFNPDHLFIGTQSDNLQDCYRKGRLGGFWRTPGWHHTEEAKRKISEARRKVVLEKKMAKGV